VELPNGQYQVETTQADCMTGHTNQLIVVEGVTIVTGETVVTGMPLVRSGMVTVSDGLLTVTIGGTGGEVILNQLMVTRLN